MSGLALACGPVFDTSTVVMLAVLAGAALVVGGGLLAAAYFAGRALIRSFN